MKTLVRPIAFAATLVAASLFMAADPFVVSARAEGETRPVAADQLVRLGGRLSAKGDLSNGISVFQKVLEREPKNAAALRGAASLMDSSGYPELAYDYWLRLAALEPKAPDVMLGLAAGMTARGLPEGALGLVEQAEAAGVHVARLFRIKGEALDLVGRQGDAQLAYNTVLAMEPGNPDAAVRLALSLAISEDYRGALRLLQPLANNPAGADDIRMTTALIYALSGQTDAATQIMALSDRKDEAEAKRPFFAMLPTLAPRHKAMAVLLGRLPTASERAAAVAAGEVRGDHAPVPAAALSRGSGGGAVSSDVMAPPARSSRQSGATTSSVDAPVRAVTPVAGSPREEPMLEVKTRDLPPVPEAASDLSAANTVPGTAGDVALAELRPAAGGAGARPLFAPAPRGHYWLQLAANDNLDLLRKAWRESLALAGGLLDGFVPVRQVVVASAGQFKGKVVNRLLVGPFADPKKADAFHAALRKQGVEAVVNVKPTGLTTLDAKPAVLPAVKVGTPRGVGPR